MVIFSQKKNMNMDVFSTNVLHIPKTKDQHLLAQYYSMADVFVICSKQENFPTTCLEAQCCGTPVVGFDTGGTKETSLLSTDDFVPYGNLVELRKAVLKRISNTHTNLAELARYEYSSKNMAQKYIDMYNDQGSKERVLLIDVNCKYSSTGKIVYDLYRNIRETGREAAVCYGRGKKIKEENIYKFGLDLETVIHAGLSRLTGFNGYFSFFSTLRLINFIKRYKPDIIHIHELHAYFVNLGMLLDFIKKEQIPVIWTFHCEYMYTGKCGYSYECDKFKDNCGQCPMLRDYPKSLWFDRTSKMLNDKKKALKNLSFEIVTPSNWLAERARTSFLKDKKISVIHNGIDTDIFKPTDPIYIKKKLGIPQDKKVILALAPNIMNERKGGRRVKELAEMMKDDNVFFVVVG